MLLRSRTQRFGPLPFLESEARSLREVGPLLLMLRYSSLSESHSMFSMAFSYSYSYSYSAIAVLVLDAVSSSTSRSTSTISLSTSTIEAKIAQLQKPFPQSFLAVRPSTGHCLETPSPGGYCRSITFLPHRTKKLGLNYPVHWFWE